MAGRAKFFYLNKIFNREVIGGERISVKDLRKSTDIQDRWLKYTIEESDVEVNYIWSGLVWI